MERIVPHGAKYPAHVPSEIEFVYCQTSQGVAYPKIANAPQCIRHLDVSHVDGKLTDEKLDNRRH